MFVDDDRYIRDGIRRVFRRLADRWTMTFCANGEEALELVGRTPVDVIVTDIGLSGIHGSELLRRVVDASPTTIRIVLSGRSDKEAADNAAKYAHRFVDKPCDPQVLEDVLQRCLALQARLREPRLRGIVGGLSGVPAIPNVYRELTSAIEGDRASVAELVPIVQKDPLICAKLLQLVNSAFYGRAQAVATVEQALAYLGMETVRKLVLGIEIFERTPLDAERTGFDVGHAQVHALQVATAAQRMAANIAPANIAFTAGLLHDVGSLFLASRRPALVERAQAARAQTGGELHAVEHALLGSSHAELGAYLMGLWALPDVVVEALAYHHTPAEIDVHAPGLATILHVADALLDGREDDPHPLDVAHLARLGLEGELEHWRAIADEVRGERLLVA